MSSHPPPSSSSDFVFSVRRHQPQNIETNNSDPGHLASSMSLSPTDTNNTNANPNDGATSDEESVDMGHVIRHIVNMINADEVEDDENSDAVSAAMHHIMISLQSESPRTTRTQSGSSNDADFVIMPDMYIEENRQTQPETNRRIEAFLSRSPPSRSNSPPPHSSTISSLQCQLKKDTSIPNGPNASIASPETMQSEITTYDVALESTGPITAQRITGWLNRANRFQSIQHSHLRATVIEIAEIYDDLCCVLYQHPTAFSKRADYGRFLANHHLSVRAINDALQAALNDSHGVAAKPTKESSEDISDESSCDSTSINTCAIAYCSGTGMCIPCCNNGHFLHGDCMRQLMLTRTGGAKLVCPMCRDMLMENILQVLDIRCTHDMMNTACVFSTSAATISRLFGTNAAGINQTAATPLQYDKLFGKAS